ncbi:hypothetical protein [Photobacterium leiognathi]|uniref:hypothetical protein n=1 Tax=Photobacterium leiognathi TaxID=553611 RepID=UPI003DA18B84
MNEKELRLKVNLRFKKAMAKSGYLSLRSIIESHYYFPQTFALEPIRRAKIKKIIVIKKEKILSAQQLAISTYKRKKCKNDYERLNKLKALFNCVCVSTNSSES